MQVLLRQALKPSKAFLPSILMRCMSVSDLFGSVDVVCLCGVDDNLNFGFEQTNSSAQHVRG